MGSQEKGAGNQKRKPLFQDLQNKLPGYRDKLKTTDQHQIDDGMGEFSEAVDSSAKRSYKTKSVKPARKDTIVRVPKKTKIAEAKDAIKDATPTEVKKTAEMSEEAVAQLVRTLRSEEPLPFISDLIKNDSSDMEALYRKSTADNSLAPLVASMFAIDSTTMEGSTRKQSQTEDNTTTRKIDDKQSDLDSVAEDNQSVASSEYSVESVDSSPSNFDLVSRVRTKGSNALGAIKGKAKKVGTYFVSMARNAQTIDDKQSDLDSVAEDNQSVASSDSARSADSSPSNSDLASRVRTEAKNVMNRARAQSQKITTYVTPRARSMMQGAQAIEESIDRRLQKFDYYANSKLPGFSNDSEKSIASDAPGNHSADRTEEDTGVDYPLSASPSTESMHYKTESDDALRGYTSNLDENINEEQEERPRRYGNGAHISSSHGSGDKDFVFGNKAPVVNQDPIQAPISNTSNIVNDKADTPKSSNIFVAAWSAIRSFYTAFIAVLSNLFTNKSEELNYEAKSDDIDSNINSPAEQALIKEVDRNVDSATPNFNMEGAHHDSARRSSQDHGK